MASEKLKHLHSTAKIDAAWQTECGLRTMAPSTHAVRDPARVTCEDCKRIRQERHDARMATDTTYRRFHEQVAAFAALGVKAGEYGQIKLTFAEADKVLRKLRRVARGDATQADLVAERAESARLRGEVAELRAGRGGK